MSDLVSSPNFVRRRIPNIQLSSEKKEMVDKMIEMIITSSTFKPKLFEIEEVIRVGNEKILKIMLQRQGIKDENTKDK